MLTDKQLQDASLDQLMELKSKIASFIKAKKEGEKERKVQEKVNKAEWAKSNLAKGDTVVFSYKGAELEGEVTELRDKTFSVAFEYEGEDKILSRLYHLLINKVDEDEDAA